MKRFQCQSCGQMLHFVNGRCERCGHALGYLPARAELVALEPVADGVWRSVGVTDREAYRFCLNASYDACNWLIPQNSAETLCLTCRTNRVVPDLGNAEHLILFQRLQTAKRRLFYGLLRFHLPVHSKFEDAERGMAFDFLAAPDPTFRETAPVMTGHAEGVITINIAEADDVVREAQRKSMAEPYRTILGHFRHEIGHHYWENLVQNRPALEPFRGLFGDERVDYGAALESHYANGAQPDWPSFFVSAYASVHPWEDWAESWAHYMHLVDALETAYSYGLSLNPLDGADPALVTMVNFDAYDRSDFDSLLRAWLPLTLALNSLNRSMGQPDLYPFVLTPAITEKLRFVHDLIWRVRA